MTGYSNSPSKPETDSCASASNAFPAVHDKQKQNQRAVALLVVMLALLAAILGCNGLNFNPQPAPTPIPTRTLLPTFTPSPETISGLQIVITPPKDGTPGVIIVPPGVNPGTFLPTFPPPQATEGPSETANPVNPEGTPLDTATSTETASPTPTITETPTWTATFTLTPTPFVVSENAEVALLDGPSVEFPLIAILGQNVPVPVTGRNTEGTWLQLCCVNGRAVWVAASNVHVLNDISSVPLLVGATPPPPTPTFTPTDTATATPTPTATLYLFQKTLGPQLSPVDVNGNLLTIYAKIYVGRYDLPVTASGCIRPPTPQPAGKEVPLEGYFLKVQFFPDGQVGTPQAFDRPQTNTIVPSTGTLYFQCSAAPGAGNQLEFNYKYEYRVPDTQSDAFKKQWYAENPANVPLPPSCTLFGNGTWSVTVVDGAGQQLSDPATFLTVGCSSNYREAYIAWVRIR